MADLSGVSIGVKIIDSRIRGPVRDFSFAMERALRLNDDKGGWGESSFEYLLSQLRKELSELQSALNNQGCWGEGDVVQKYKSVMGEACDLANFSMMIHDRARAELRKLAALAEEAMVVDQSLPEA